MAHGVMSRLSFEDQSLFPVWSPNGTEIAFSSSGGVGRDHVYRTSTGGASEASRITNTEFVRPIATSWSPDGDLIILDTLRTGTWDLVATHVRPGHRQYIGVISLSGEPRGEPLLHEPYAERWPALSPDGRFVTYATEEGGRFEIYVRTFPDVNGGRWQLPSNNGNWPFWGPDGKEFFYFATADDALIAVPIQTEPTFQAGVPQKLFGGDYVRGGSRQFDITPDGSRFLMIRESQNVEQQAEIHVVLNWTEELKRLVPTDN